MGIIKMRYKKYSMEWMKKIYFLGILVLALVVFACSLWMILDYLVTEKYHVEGDELEEIIYTVKERAKEIRLLKKYFSLCAVFSLTILVSLIFNFLQKE